MPPAARIMDMHVCPMVTGIVPHVGGPILPPAVPNVITCFMPQAVVGTMATCVGPPDVILKGSIGVMVGGRPAARMFDMTAHGGMIITGAPTVIIGEVSPASPSSGSMAMVAPGGLATDAGGGADVPETVKTLIAAGRDGTPFCEQCNRG